MRFRGKKEINEAHLLLSYTHEMIFQALTDCFTPSERRLWQNWRVAVLPSKWHFQPHVLPLLWQESSGEIASCIINCISRPFIKGVPDRIHRFLCLKLCLDLLLQVNYSQPLVAVKFLNITANQDVNIECKINANNIPIGSERDKFAGRVSFKLRINTVN